MYLYHVKTYFNTIFNIYGIPRIYHNLISVLFLEIQHIPTLPFTIINNVQMNINGHVSFH